MLLPAVNATGSAQPSNPWAFYDYLRPEAQAYASHGLGTGLAASLYFVPFSTVVVSYKAENIIRGPLSIAAFRTPGNISAFTDELLDWDTGIDVAPPRPSGKISVTLHFTGRGAPRPLGDY